VGLDSERRHSVLLRGPPHGWRRRTLTCLAELLSSRGPRPGDRGKPRIREGTPLALDVEALVIRVGRRFSNQKRLVVWVKPPVLE
jgi:hypothetical protein